MLTWPYPDMVWGEWLTEVYPVFAEIGRAVTETRNPGHDQSMVERQLHERLGLEHFLWLTHGAISGDDTDGHIGIQFWGSSFACGAQGEWLARAGEQHETLHAEIDMARSEQVSRIWPFPRDRRIDAYDDLLKRFID